jgi:hypothetical protein
VIRATASESSEKQCLPAFEEHCFSEDSELSAPGAGIGSPVAFEEHCFSEDSEAVARVDRNVQ